MPEIASLQLAKQLIAQASVTPDDHGCQEIIAERLRAIDALADAAGALGEAMADEDGCAAAIDRINRVLGRGGAAGFG